MCIRDRSSIMLDYLNKNKANINKTDEEIIENTDVYKRQFQDTDMQRLQNQKKTNGEI